MGRLVPLVHLREAKNWSAIGFKAFSNIQLASFVALFGSDALQTKDVLNDFHAEVVSLRHDSVGAAASTVECLFKFGLNYLTVEYYFSILTLAQTFSVNREDF